MIPDAAKRNFFYGVNFELSYELPPFAPSPWALEIRPIIGVRNKEWEFIVNPIIDVSFGPGGEADFAPAARLARNLGNDRFVGLEYYSFYGKIGNILPDLSKTKVSGGLPPEPLTDGRRRAMARWASRRGSLIRRSTVSLPPACCSDRACHRIRARVDAKRAV